MECYHSNTLYHDYGITDETGTLIEAYQYDAYGKQTVITDGNDDDSIVNFGANNVRTVGGNSTVNNPYMYTGQRFDAETGLFLKALREFNEVLGNLGYAQIFPGVADITFKKCEYEYCKDRKSTGTGLSEEAESKVAEAIEKARGKK